MNDIGNGVNKRVYAFAVLMVLLMSLYMLVDRIPQPVPEIPANGPAYEPCLVRPLPPEPVASFPSPVWPEWSVMDRPAMDDMLSGLDADGVVKLGGKSYYGFRDRGYASLTPDGTQLPYDVYYGVGLEAQGTRLLLSWHNYTDNGVVPTDVSLLDVYQSVGGSLGQLSVAQGERMALETADFPSGLYELQVGWSDGTLTTLYAAVRNSTSAYCCNMHMGSTKYIGQWQERRNDLASILADSGVTPENSLDYSDDFWAYPVSAGMSWRYRCDNRRWIGLARGLVGDRVLPDAQKAVLIHDWMVANLAYDDYKAYVLDMSRAKYYDDYSGKYSMWDTHVGVCADFATAYAIMLRSVGVPCVCIDEDDEHVWNVAYIDGQWVEIDVTEDVERYVMTEDVQDVITFPDVDTYGAFGVPFSMDRLDPGRNRINSGVYTRELVTGC